MHKHFGQILKGCLVIGFLTVNFALCSQSVDTVRIRRLLSQCELSFQENKLKQCRDSAEQILKIDSSNCEAYMILGKVYANIPKNYLAEIMKEQVEYTMIYCLAVDMFEKAKEVDTLCRENADKEIALYSKSFPTLPWGTTDDLYGKEYLIKGWINRKTTVRCRNWQH